MEEGTGKTHVTIATMVHLYRTGKINGTLVLAPSGVQHNWGRNELPLHLPDDVKKTSTCIVWNSNAGLKESALFQWHLENTKPESLLIVIANIEALRTERFDRSLNPLFKRQVLAIVDEATIIKNPKAQQSKLSFRIGDRCAYRRILTGTPVTQGPLDLWSQCRFLDRFALRYPSFTAFKNEFAISQEMILGQRHFSKVVGYKNLHKLQDLIAPFSYRVTKAECLDLPPKVYQYRYVELTPEQKVHYKDLEKKCLTIVNDKLVTTTTVLTALLRLHQVTLGYITADDLTMQPIPHNRINALLQLYEQIQGKAIVFCRFKEDCRQVHHALVGAGRHPVLYHGDVSDAERSAAVAAFQEGTATDLVATRAASRGLTLHAASNVVYYSQGFSLEDRLQSEDRAHRIGQEKSVLYTDLVSRDTIDEKVIAALRAKQSLADQVLLLRQLITA